MRRKAYRAVNVKRVLVESMVADHPKEAACVGFDVAKREILTVVRWPDGNFERPWRAENPEEIPDLIGRLGSLAAGRSLMVALESTGTYGDALRQALTDARLDVQRVSGKAVHDYAEIFDGVPSQHDGKDAAIVAELAALGKSTAWPYQPAKVSDQELEYWVERLDSQQRIETLWLGRLEALLARYWPEATRYLELGSATLLRALMEYGGPGKLVADPRAAARLAGWGGPFLEAEKIQRLLEVSATSLGVRQTAVDVRRMQEAAAAAWAARAEGARAEKSLKQCVEAQPALERQSRVVGVATACVLWYHLGDPADYHCAQAYRKAMGLNLKERSSGRYQGQLRITKRGPAAVRRWMYFAAMRLAQKAGVTAWYQVKKAKHDNGTWALVAVMRKLALGLYQVGVAEEVFDARRLFTEPPARRRRSRGSKRRKGGR
jgi:transposase